MTIENKIKQYGRENGIDLIGFTGIEPFWRIGEVQREREKRGHLSGFEEKEIQRRVYPLLTLKNAKSIVAIGVGYYMPQEQLGDGGETYGIIARTAWGKDYHQILKEKLEKLMTYIKKMTGDFDYKIFVDTGPLSDREVAYRAGLGWFGKNNMLITGEWGSWVFLGYALTSLELQGDKPLEKGCLGCNLCIQACPGRALDEGYGMNAKNCLSYITQTKDEISENNRRKLGSQIYGCDICQQVCPHNQGIREGNVNEFVSGKETYRPKLEQFIGISTKEFKELYGSTAAGWRGRNVLRRNAIIAAGNSEDLRLLACLEKTLKDDSKMIREYGAWAIHRMGEEGRSVLENHLETEKDEEIARQIKDYLKE